MQSTGKACEAVDSKSNQDTRTNLLASDSYMQMQIKLFQLIRSIGGLTKLQDLHEFRVEAKDGHRIDMRYIQGSLVP